MHSIKNRVFYWFLQSINSLTFIKVDKCLSDMWSHRSVKCVAINRGSDCGHRLTHCTSLTAHTLPYALPLCTTGLTSGLINWKTGEHLNECQQTKQWMTHSLSNHSIKPTKPLLVDSNSLFDIYAIIEDINNNGLELSQNQLKFKNIYWKIKFKLLSVLMAINTIKFNINLNI